jgi:hypothetical protein
MFTIKNLRPTPLVPLATPLLLLTLQLLTACGKQEIEVKNYASTTCASEQKVKLAKSVLSLASGYFIFNEARFVPDFAEVKVAGKYATGKTELLSDAFSSKIAQQLGLNGSPAYNIKVASALEMPEKIEKKQLLKFSAPCQAKNALLDNEQLRDEPGEGAIYLLASKKSFIFLHEGSYMPEPTTPVKFKILNTRTNLMEKVTIYLNQIIAGESVRKPSNFVEQIQNKILNWDKENEIANNGKWSIHRNQTTSEGNSRYFTLTKESDGGEPITGEIQSVEFVLEDKE